MGVTGEEQVRGAPPTPRRPPEGAGRCAGAVPGRCLTASSAGAPPAPRPEYPVQDTFAEVRTTSADFENFSDDDELWLSDLETRAIDLENELSVWREVRQRALGEQEYGAEQVPSRPHPSFRRVA